ncbi:MAG: MFS transporter, partial [Ktedonobacteraceae bacterium]|nr:MFS transporter [Ktedonobacteraceae bacterium]
MSTNTDISSEAREDRTLHRPLSLWRNRDYLLLLSGQTISGVGSQVSLVAFPLLILALTHSPAQAGLMTAVRSLPRLIVTLPAGALVDRWDRKRLMLLCDTGRALALGSIPLALWLGYLSDIQLYLVALIEGTFFAFFTLAESAALPRVVPAEQLADAASRNEALFSVSDMIGQALGPILFSLGRVVPFLTDAVSYIASVISLLFIKTRFQSERAARGKKGTASLGKDIWEGVTWLWDHTVIRFLAILTFGLMTPCSGYLLILIVQGQRMHASDYAMSFILGSSGLGSIAGALLAAPLYRRFGFVRVLLVSAWIWALTWLVYALAPNVLVLGICNALSFIVVPVYSIVQYSYRLANIPDALQGRVNSVFRLLAFGGQPLGIAITGLLLQSLGPIYTVV